MVVVPRIRANMIESVRSGIPAQFREMALKRRCSVGFHFEQPYFSRCDLLGRHGQSDASFPGRADAPV